LADVQLTDAWKATAKDGPGDNSNPAVYIALPVVPHYGATICFFPERSIIDFI